MALFVARHQHEAETCPAKDPAMGKMLLDHLGAESSRTHGVTIHGEAVLDGQHTLILIAEADDQTRLEQFLQPFAMAGSVDVWPASHCAAIVERGGCESAQL
jgi:Protein of unknown function (DUF3303)